MARGLFPWVREFVRVWLGLPREYESEDVVEEMEDTEEGAQQQRHGGSRSKGSRPQSDPFQWVWLA